MGEMVKRPTIKDIARSVGVSAATVSRVLDHDPRISSETSRRVLQKASELNYRPNIMARALVKRGSSLIGLLLRHIQGSFFSDIIAGVQEVVEREGYSIILCNSDMNAVTERDHLRVLLDKQVEGIIITPITTEGVNRNAYNHIGHANVPLVMLGNPKEGANHPYVKVDNMLGGYLAGKHLIGLGHSLIAYISPRQDELISHKRTLHSENIERYLGLGQAMREHGHAERLTVIEAPNEDVTETIVARLMSLNPRPTALFAYGDMMAFKIMRLLEDKGCRVPEDFSIIGYDDLDISCLVNPPLSTISQPKKDLGKIAARKLLGMMKGLPTTATVLKPLLIPRNSTAPHRGA
ncbi:MAG: LacI family DNA-binding transcriptional regulator [bacterium]|nr:LacI family DNA-binding transcriptional regulator [Candidatus Sumerlaeota bacterium]